MSARKVVEWSEADIDEIMGIVERLALDVANGDTSIPQSRLAEILEAVSFCIDEGGWPMLELMHMNRLHSS